MRLSVCTLVLAATAACAGSETPAADSAPPAAAAPQAAAAPSPTIRVISPAEGSAVTSPVKVQVAVDGFGLVAATTPVAEGSGHLHFFIDTPPEAVPEGQMIPLDSATKYVHAGKEPFTERDLTLAPGEHTIWIVAANSGHLALRTPAPVKLTVKVQ
jgi:hypothetical protein